MRRETEGKSNLLSCHMLLLLGKLISLLRQFEAEVAEPKLLIDL